MLPLRPVGLAALAILAGGFLSGSQQPAARANIVVLVGRDAPPHDDVLAGFRAQLGEGNIQPDLAVHRLESAAQVEAALREIGRSRPDLVLAFGPAAVEFSQRNLADLPTVAGLVLKRTALEGTRNLTGVYLEFPVDTELQWLSRILPGQRRVGVLFNAAENETHVREASRAAARLGLRLRERRIGSPSELPTSLESLENDADVLWGIADTLVLTPETVKPILLFSVRNSIPFVGLSEPWVKAGALYALDRDYEDVGRQCGELAVRILGGASPGSIEPVPPRKVVLSVNKRVAQLMRIDLPVNLLKEARSVFD